MGTLALGPNGFDSEGYLDDDGASLSDFDEDLVRAEGDEMDTTEDKGSISPGAQIAAAAAAAATIGYPLLHCQKLSKVKQPKKWTFGSP
ncbi:MAG: hypothetical protein Q9226_000828 [Calogaya cf. arnoldii]